MKLFEKICKADHILAWTGEDRYLEIRLLHVKGGMGNMAEWQLLAETIEHIHEKRLASKKQIRPRRATTSTSCVLVTEDEPVSPVTTRRGTKRDSKIKIDYKQYHQEGIVANKISRTNKVLPRSTGPSLSRIAAQEVIRGRKERKGKATKVDSTSLANKKPFGKPPIREIGSLLPQNKHLSPVISSNVRPTLNLTATKQPVPATLSHTLGSPSSDDNYLPDLVSPILGTSSHGTVIPEQPNKSTETIPNTLVISLISLPAISCTQDPPPRPHAKQCITTTNLNDLQSTLEFSTDPVLGSESSGHITGELSTHTLDIMVPLQRNREVVTSDDIETDTEHANAFAQSSPKECSTPKGYSEHDNDRKVVTSNDKVDCTSVTNNTNTKTLRREECSENSQAFSSPRSVVTEPDQQEIDTANILIGMNNAAGIDDPLPQNYEIDKEHELPVNSDRLEDFVEQINKSQNKQSESEDSDATVEYPERHNDTNKTMTDSELSPKGHINYKHYGIKRQSPDQSKSRTYHCYFCEAICHSKHQLNRHHKSEHAKVKCPTCIKQFPTPDALQRHGYTHRDDHQLICSICQEVCAFKSDMANHMEKHKEDRPWVCTHDNCGKDFKRKSDLTAHEVVHRGEYFICEFPGCTYKNVDPRLVKRHQRVHTKEAKVKCKKCNRRFVFYQQMKRHLLNDH